MGRVKNKQVVNALGKLYDDLDAGLPPPPGPLVSIVLSNLTAISAYQEVEWKEDRERRARKTKEAEKRKREVEKQRKRAERRLQPRPPRVPKNPEVTARSSSLRIAQKQSLADAGQGDETAGPPATRASKRKVDDAVIDDNTIAVSLLAKKSSRENNTAKAVKTEPAKNPASTKAKTKGKDINATKNTSPARKISGTKAYVKGTVIDAPKPTPTTTAKKPTRSNSVPNPLVLDSAKTTITAPVKKLSGVATMTAAVKPPARSTSVPKPTKLDASKTIMTAAAKPLARSTSVPKPTKPDALKTILPGTKISTTGMKSNAPKTSLAVSDNKVSHSGSASRSLEANTSKVTKTTAAKKPSRPTSVLKDSKPDASKTTISASTKAISGTKTTTTGMDNKALKTTAVADKTLAPRQMDAGSSKSTTTVTVKKTSRSTSALLDNTVQRITRGNSAATGMDWATLTATMGSPTKKVTTANQAETVVNNNTANPNTAKDSSKRNADIAGMNTTTDMAPAKRTRQAKSHSVPTTGFKDGRGSSIEDSFDSDSEGNASRKIDPPREKNGKSLRRPKSNRDDNAFDPHGGGRHKKKKNAVKETQEKQKSGMRRDVDKNLDVEKTKAVQKEDELEDEQESAAEEDEANKMTAMSESRKFSDTDVPLPVDGYVTEGYDEDDLDDLSNASAILSSRRFNASQPSATENTTVDRPMTRYTKTRNSLTLELDLSPRDTRSILDQNRMPQSSEQISSMHNQDLVVKKARRALAVSIAEKRVANIQHQTNPHVVHGMLPKSYPTKGQLKKPFSLGAGDDCAVYSSIRDEPFSKSITPKYNTSYGFVTSSAGDESGVGDRFGSHFAHDGPSGAGYPSARNQTNSRSIATEYNTQYGPVSVTARDESGVGERVGFHSAHDRPFGAGYSSVRDEPLSGRNVLTYNTPYPSNYSSGPDEGYGREYASMQDNMYDHGNSAARDERDPQNFASMHDGPVNHGSRDYGSSYIPNYSYPDPDAPHTTVGLLDPADAGAYIRNYRRNAAAAQDVEATAAQVSSYDTPAGGNGEESAVRPYQSIYGSGD